MAGTVTGTAGYRERIALPPEAVLEVQLLDVSRMDVAATVLSARRFAMTGVPQAFELAYDDALIEPAMSYSVSARILLGDKLLFITDTKNAVLTRGAGDRVDLMLVRVPQADPNSLENTSWRVSHLDGAAVEAERMPEIAFAAGGGFGLRGACNSFRGTAEVAGDKLTLPANMAGTLMACSEQAETLDRALLAAFPRVAGFTIDGETLVMNDAQGGEVLRLTRLP
ncbi:YbaY family lipoprotein [Ruegeria marina]|uniref:Putative lipoprotein n=1 Tax=Ruegeria marina TaxID=639004 RepID=A0A1G7AYG0_9RHOB|nr:YbaY family lipoprotein [Ruegeria marina]SDE19006.1 putative lipoprotein [Ruegeria marina]